MNFMVNKRQSLGRLGERLAEKYLIAQGYTILERNVRSRYGELDLIASDKGMLVFVEVKTRSSFAFGYPEAAVTQQKQNHILEAASYYLMEHPKLCGDWRVDVIAIRTKKNSPPEITHFENAIS